MTRSGVRSSSAPPNPKIPTLTGWDFFARSPVLVRLRAQFAGLRAVAIRWAERMLRLGVPSLASAKWLGPCGDLAGFRRPPRTDTEPSGVGHKPRRWFWLELPFPESSGHSPVRWGRSLPATCFYRPHDRRGRCQEALQRSPKIVQTCLSCAASGQVFNASHTGFMSSQRASSLFLSQTSQSWHR